MILRMERLLFCPSWFPWQHYNSTKNNMKEVFFFSCISAIVTSMHFNYVKILSLCMCRCLIAWQTAKYCKKKSVIYSEAVTTKCHSRSAKKNKMIMPLGFQVLRTCFYNHAFTFFSEIVWFTPIHPLKFVYAR